MRVLRKRTLALLTSAVLITGGLLASPVAAQDKSPAADKGSAVIDRVLELASGDTPAQASDMTMALVELRKALPTLTGADRREAQSLLARPTDGPNDPQGFGYTVAEAAPLCSASLCVHYVASTSDAPPAVDANANGVPDGVEFTLATMDQVLAFFTQQLGFRPPAADGIKGGDARFDIYLSDVGSQSLYGFCAPENKVAERYRADGYCVLDNDFVEFDAPPDQSLIVTAAHEFFHAIQFNYDFAEDSWLMEATATWVEERYATHVNDSRQYLPASQIRLPSIPLDLFNRQTGSHYGNFIFFELLSQRYGNDIVRDIWSRADSDALAPDLWSVQAIDRALRARHSSMAKFYPQFAAANVRPASFYAEGAAWPKGKAKKSTLRKRKKLSRSKRLDHLTNASYELKPRKSFKRGKLKLTFSLPKRGRGGSAAITLVKRNGKAKIKVIRINKRGHGKARVAFGSKRVRSVTVTLANSSLRMNCWQRTDYGCRGIARDDNGKFRFTART